MRTEPGSSAFIPRNLLQSPKITTLATRLKMPPAQQAAYTDALVCEIADDPERTCTSYAYTEKIRRSTNAKTAEAIRREWQPAALLSLHSESKILSTLDDKYKNEDRLAVAVATQDSAKLLGIPKYQHGTDKLSGTIISCATVSLLHDWGCQNNVFIMVFDTTSSNTGLVSAACTSLQQVLWRALLWSGCRHRIGGLILSHVFEDLRIEASKSPEISIFKRLRTNYNMINLTPKSSIKTYHIETINEEGQLLAEKLRAETLRQCSMDYDFVRDDHRDLTELTVLYLNGHTKKAVSIKRPGALHKARWMAKLLM